MGAIAALIIIAGFGISLLIYFHFEDKKNTQIHMGEYMYVTFYMNSSYSR